MKKRLWIIFAFILVMNCVVGQELHQKAAVNFEAFFKSDKCTFPDKKFIIFKDHSELWVRKTIPEELKLMMEYDSTTFYEKYLEHIRTSRDTLIKIQNLEIDNSAKYAYGDFKTSIFEGEKKKKFNYKKDREYSKKLKFSFNQTGPPHTGFYQKATMITKLPKGEEQDDQIIITFSNDLEVISFVVIE